jgi:hypothetical protein
LRDTRDGYTLRKDNRNYCGNMGKGENVSKPRLDMSWWSDMKIQNTLLGGLIGGVVGFGLGAVVTGCDEGDCFSVAPLLFTVGGLVGGGIIGSMVK